MYKVFSFYFQLIKEIVQKVFCYCSKLPFP